MHCVNSGLTNETVGLFLMTGRMPTGAESQHTLACTEFCMSAHTHMDFNLIRADKIF